MAAVPVVWSCGCASDRDIAAEALSTSDDALVRFKCRYIRC